LAWTGWFRALGDASRVLILNELAIARRPMTVEEIVDAVDVGQSTASHHFKLLAYLTFPRFPGRFGCGAGDGPQRFGSSGTSIPPAVVAGL
jgi:Bacterial regulatory protein, arsR family